MRRVSKLVVIVTAIAVATIAGFSARQLTLSKQAEKRRAEYQVRLDACKQTLPLGASRAEIESYLHGSGQDFTQRCCLVPKSSTFADLVKIGEEPPPWFCNKRNVYIVFAYRGAEPYGRGAIAEKSDQLSSIHLSEQLEQCL